MPGISQPEITYFVGTVEDALLRPLHFGHVIDADSDWIKNVGDKGYPSHLFVYKGDDLLLIIDRDALCLRDSAKWNSRWSKCNCNPSYPDILARYVRFAVYFALKGVN